MFGNRKSKSRKRYGLGKVLVDLSKEKTKRKRSKHSKKAKTVKARKAGKAAIVRERKAPKRIKRQAQADQGWFDPTKRAALAAERGATARGITSDVASTAATAMQAWTGGGAMSSGGGSPSSSGADNTMLYVGGAALVAVLLVSMSGKKR